MNPAASRRLSIIALLSALSAFSSHAANLTWNNAGPSNTWDTTTANWTGTATTWTQADNASFAGTGEAITLGEAITVTNLGITSSGYSIAGGGFTLTVNGTITNTQTATLTARVAGGDFTKAGGGNLVLNNASANTYTGNTYIQAGTLQTRASGALASTTTLDISSGATVDLRASQTVAALTGSGTVNQSQTAGTTTLTVSSVSTDSVFAGVLKDGDSIRFLALTKSGASSLTLTGANTFTGNTTLNAGTLATSATGTFGAGNVFVAGGATLTFGNAASVGDLKGLTFASTSAIELDFAGTEALGSVFNSVTSTFLADGTYDAAGLNSFFGVTAFSGTGFLSVSAIPEPSTFAFLAGLGALACVTSRRRRQG